jgi:hypothetical protein
MGGADMKSTGNLTALRKDVAFWSGQVFGTLTAAASTISVVQHIFDIALVPTFARGLWAYRYIANTATEWLLTPFVYAVGAISNWLKYPISIDLPDWWLDLTAISIVSAGAAVRAMLWQRQVKTVSLFQILVLMAGTIVFGITMFGVLWLIMILVGLLLAVLQVPASWNPFVISKATNIDEYRRNETERYYHISLIAVLFSVVGFFLLNQFTL